MKKVVVGVILIAIVCILIAGCASTTPVKDPINITYYYSSTCEYCTKMNEDFDRLAQNFSSGFVLTKYDVNKEPVRFRDDITRYNSDAVVPFVIVGNKTYSGYNESTYYDITYLIVSR